MATINGTDGADNLVGTDQADVINGLDGNDVIDGKFGTDTLNGGPGDDTFVFTVGGFSNNPPPFGSIDGGTGVDTLDLSRVFGPQTTGGDANSFQLLLGIQRFNVTNVERVIGTSGPDTLSFFGFGSGVEVFGGQGNDNIQGGSGADRLFGGQGTDNLAGGPGDQLFGEDGNDFVFVSGQFGGAATTGSADGGVGIDTLATDIQFEVDLAAGTARSGQVAYSIVGFENVQVTSSGSASTALGDAGNNVLSVIPSSDDGRAGVTFDGRGGQDTLTGSRAGDVLRGGDGDDRIEGRDGADQLFGDAGDDLLFGGAGDDRLDGGAGSDLVSYESSPFIAVAVDLRAGTARSFEGVDALVSIEGARGTDFDDTLTGNEDANRFEGRAGRTGWTVVEGTTSSTAAPATTVSRAATETTFSSAGRAMTSSTAGPGGTGSCSRT